MLDPESVKRALDGVTRVFHMAGVVGHRASDEPRLQAVNVDGARTVLDLCARAGVERVVFTSSVSTIGPAGGPGHPRDEGAWLIDGDDGRADFRYGRTKAAGEQAALAAAAAGLDVVITNPGFAIGPGDVHRVSSWPVEEYLRGRLRFTVPGGLSYVDARDVAVGHLLAEERGKTGERYILTNDDGNLSHRDFFALVGSVTGKPRRQLHTSPGMLRPILRVGSVLRLPLPLDDQELASSAHWWYYTAAKARAELGFSVRPIARDHPRHRRLASEGRIPQALTASGLCFREGPEKGEPWPSSFTAAAERSSRARTRAGRRRRRSTRPGSSTRRCTTRPFRAAAVPRSSA